LKRSRSSISTDSGAPLRAKRAASSSSRSLAARRLARPVSASREASSRAAQVGEQAQLRVRGPRRRAQQQRDQPHIAPVRGIQRPARAQVSERQRGHRRGAQPQRMRPGHRKQRDLRGDDERRQLVAHRDAGVGRRNDEGLHQPEAQRLDPQEQPQQHEHGHAPAVAREQQQAGGDEQARDEGGRERAGRQHHEVQRRPADGEHGQHRRERDDARAHHAALGVRALGGHVEARVQARDEPEPPIAGHRPSPRKALMGSA
jgi:hypothetical protein